MLTRPRRSTPGVLLLSLFMGAAAPASGCGFDGILNGSFSAMHPKSFGVAFAISDAVATGTIDKSEVAPIVQGSAGYWRAVSRLNGLQRLLSAAAKGDSVPAPALSVLLIDSSLWTRLNPGPQGFDIELHTAGAKPDDVVVVTSEAILADILEEKLPVGTALSRGLIAIDGKADAAANILRIVTGAFDRELRNNARVQMQPTRLFGPAR